MGAKDGHAADPEMGPRPVTPPAGHRNGQGMGFGALLRAWRAAAGKRRGHRLTQIEVAAAVGRSERWYRGLESGATERRLTKEVCDALAKVLQLDDDGRRALLLSSTGGIHHIPSSLPGAKVSPQLRLLLDKQLPAPAYVSDLNWNILAYNAAMAVWWPWVMKPGANLIRTALLDPESRAQFLDWPHHAAMYVRVLKFAVASRRSDDALHTLIQDVCADPDVQRIWDQANEVAENRDGHVHRMLLPALSWEPVDLVSHITYPASQPDCRLVVITWLGHNDDEHDVVADAGSRTVRSAEEAAAQAGADAVPLRALSKIVGPDCQLTLSPSTQSVIWATRRPDNSWSVAQIGIHTVLARFSHSPGLEHAYEDIKHLTRAFLPWDPDKAAARIRSLVPDLRRRMTIYDAIYRDLQTEANSASRQRRT